MTVWYEQIWDIPIIAELSPTAPVDNICALVPALVFSYAADKASDFSSWSWAYSEPTESKALRLALTRHDRAHALRFTGAFSFPEDSSGGSRPRVQKRGQADDPQEHSCRLTVPITSSVRRRAKIQNRRGGGHRCLF